MKLNIEIIILMLPILLFFIFMMTSIITISYTSCNELKVDDWRRNWIIFFSWISLIGSSALFAHSCKNKNLITSIISVIIFLISNMTLSYIGYVFPRDTPTIDRSDWRRVALIVVSALSILASIIVMIAAFMLWKKKEELHNDIIRKFDNIMN